MGFSTVLFSFLVNILYTFNLVALFRIYQNLTISILHECLDLKNPFKSLQYGAIFYFESIFRKHNIFIFYK
jgi:hypothetical protein